MKVNFGGVKKPCRKVTQQYRKRTKDSRKYPEFMVKCLARDARKGHIYFFHKPKGKDATVSRERITYNSIPELTIIIENIGREWERIGKRQ